MYSNILCISAHGEVSKAQSFVLRRMYSTRIDGSTANVWDMPRSAAPGELVSMLYICILCTYYIHV